MTLERGDIRDHILKTIHTMEHLSTSKEYVVRKQFSRMIGDQFEALIALSASELRDMAGDQPSGDL
ncbi:hypothetical protein SB748_25755 [Rhizobium sp. SIMBA_035]